MPLMGVVDIRHVDDRATIKTYVGIPEEPATETRSLLGNALARISHGISSRDPANGFLPRRAQWRTAGLGAYTLPKGEASATQTGSRATGRSRQFVRNAG